MTVTRNEREQHYEIHEGDELLGWIVYRESDGVVTMIHTDVEPKWEGKGVGSELARGALEKGQIDAGTTVVPVALDGANELYDEATAMALDSQIDVSLTGSAQEAYAAISEIRI